MNFLDKIKDLAIQAKCKVSLHSGEWQNNIKDKPLCYFEKTCPDCNQYLTKYKHSFEDLGYKYDNNCEFILRCKYCLKEKTEQRHQYEEVKDTLCEGRILCTRCNMWDKKYFHEYQKISENPPMFKCKKCGIKKNAQEILKENSSNIELSVKKLFKKNLF